MRRPSGPRQLFQLRVGFRDGLLTRRPESAVDELAVIVKPHFHAEFLRVESQLRVDAPVVLPYPPESFGSGRLGRFEVQALALAGPCSACYWSA
jgi:hypothetical protein